MTRSIAGAATSLRAGRGAGARGTGRREATARSTSGHRPARGDAVARRASVRRARHRRRADAGRRRRCSPGPSRRRFFSLGRRAASSPVLAESSPWWAGRTGRRARAGEPAGRTAPSPRFRLHGVPPGLSDRTGATRGRRPPPPGSAPPSTTPTSSSWKMRSRRHGRGGHSGAGSRSTPGWTCGGCSRTPTSASTWPRGRTSPASASRHCASGRRSSSRRLGPGALHAVGDRRGDLPRRVGAARRGDHLPERGAPGGGIRVRPAVCGRRTTATPRRWSGVWRNCWARRASSRGQLGQSLRWIPLGWTPILS